MLQPPEVLHVFISSHDYNDWNLRLKNLGYKILFKKYITNKFCSNIVSEL